MRTPVLMGRVTGTLVVAGLFTVLSMVASKVVASPLSGTRRTRMGTTLPKSRARTWIVWLGLDAVGKTTDTGPLALSAIAVPAALEILSLGMGSGKTTITVPTESGVYPLPDIGKVSSL